MAGAFKRAFFAYPAQPTELVQTIATTAQRMEKAGSVALKTWPEMEIFGAHIPDAVREHIVEADIIFCDITKANLNVYYEAGYAIALGKTVAPVVNSSFAGASEQIQKDGIFDLIGYKLYQNSLELESLILEAPEHQLLNLYAQEINYHQPLFFLSSQKKTDFINGISSAIKQSKVHYRSFDPIETPRFSSTQILSHITSSSGIIIPMLGGHIVDAERHNLRAAFIAGLCHGLERETLILAKQDSDAAGPADFRESIVSVKHEDDILDHVAELAQAAMLASQSIKTQPRSRKSKGIQALTLGASAAENEFRTLEDYFVETAEFTRTARGEVGVVAGRKGSGKTAIFYMVRDSFRGNKAAIVTDLKPESHQLSLFRAELIKAVDVGAFDHTLAAFWHFVILSEILLTIQKNLEYRSKYDSKALEAAAEIGRALGKLEVAERGDFTSRINRLGSYIIQELQRMNTTADQITPEKLTNIIFRGGISDIKRLIHKNTSPKSKIVLLFDNIDKGWPTSGVDQFDIRLVRLLVEALDKINKDFDTQERDFLSVVFLRNDVYELLVDQTPDRGKSDRIRIDWTDRAKLRQVIFKRFQNSTKDFSSPFDALWRKFFTKDVDGVNTFEYFCDHCLMRPRFLIDIIAAAIANAINRGHDQVGEDDCREAVRQHSLSLVDDFGYEIRDVSGLSAEILYSLVGAPQKLSKEEVLRRFETVGILAEHGHEAFRLLLWYGVLGATNGGGRDRFIYDYEYNLRRLQAEINNSPEGILYKINPALYVALST